jgi:hypothetical protein
MSKQAKGKRCEPVKALTARMYRDCWGWLLFVALAGALAAIAALTVRAPIPPHTLGSVARFLQCTVGWRGHCQVTSQSSAGTARGRCRGGGSRCT